MSWFTEDSTPLLVIGVIVEALLLLGFIKTSRLGLLYAMVAVAILTSGCVWFEKHTVTDTKRIRDVLNSGADAVQRNDVPGVLALISPSAQTMRAQVSSQLPQVKITEAYITGLTVKVNRFNNPPSATADFFGHVSGKDKGGLSPYDHYVQRFKVTLQLENNRWLMESYELLSIQGEKSEH